ncbi:hypothetical protein C3486_14815 [Streptomyces sp. Ru73]|uniref:hypothetical protein n=1 Tax=Streptomyces sp. Ru73 TaxID=2080748 RepID=UPI000CDD0C62|nr:hypothetical protein [Streptomyces sp. Ru73]POX40214.1 hypothetical protein C3486_14815 [Streptomyces sp. Ru73]
MGDHSDLTHSEAAKKAAARRIHEHLGPDTHKAGILAADDTAKVTGRGAGELRDWGIAAGLQRRHRDWARHAGQLDHRLQEEQSGLAELRDTLLDLKEQARAALDPDDIPEDRPPLPGLPDSGAVRG